MPSPEPALAVRHVAVQGFTTEDYEPLREVLARQVAAQGRGGAALAVYSDGRCVVDLAAGDYDRDSLQLVFSISKLMTSIATAVAVQDGLVDLDQPIRKYWPDFNKASTREVTLRHVMSHRSGLCGLTGPFQYEDLLQRRDEELIGKQEPYWRPGTAHGYHTFSFGSLLDGAFKRIVGASVSELFELKVREPLGISAWLSVPLEHLSQVKPVQLGDRASTPVLEALEDGRGGVDDSLTRVLSGGGVFNRPDFLRLGLPSASGVGSPAGIARMLAATIGTLDSGQRLVQPEILEDMTRSLSFGMDAVLGVRTHFGTGFQLPFPLFPMFGSGSFGHEAGGGSVAAAHPGRGIAMSYNTDVHPPTPGASSGALAMMHAVSECAAEADRST